MEYVLQTHGLTKKYKNRPAVDRADINVRRGDIYGFVGENGSGKTTVIRLVSGLIFPDGGDFELFGVNSRSGGIVRARKKLGAIVETPSIYRNMSAYDNLKMQAGLLGISDDSRIRATLETVGLGELENDKKRAGNFSLGMRQRLGIAMALLGEPELLILDEPMNGLDPAGIVEIRELILKLNREKGMSFLISSHILTELSLVATKYGIISHGRIIREITAEELHAECGRLTFIRTDSDEKLLSLLSRELPGVPAAPDARGVKISGEIDLDGLLRRIIAEDIHIQSVNCTDMGFEEYYLSLVGGGVKHD